MNLLSGQANPPKLSLVYIDMCQLGDRVCSHIIWTGKWHTQIILHTCKPNVMTSSKAYGKTIHSVWSGFTKQSHKFPVIFAI